MQTEMKKLTTLIVLMALITSVTGQKRAMVPTELRDVAAKVEKPVLESQAIPTVHGNPYVKSGFTPEEEVIGITWYDDQTNASIQNRMVVFPDGTMGATWTRAMDYSGGYSDRGTGYNYFDGSAWGPDPSNPVEDERTGWPSYDAWGEDGEIIGAHTNETGIKISRRATKGTGNWEYVLRSGPPDHEKLIWNRLITSGSTNERVHLLALTASTDYSGTPYMGLNGALVYSLSMDGGDTWVMDNEILPEMTANEYYGFTSDTYTFAEPKGDVVAFVVGESWYDLFLMKSSDGGQTFTKTLIWEHPYPLWQPFAITDTFYCADGAHSLVIDDNDMVHVAFGINRVLSEDGTATTWFPFVDGIAYWNENMPAFSSDHHALDPYGHPNSELVEDYNLVGWTQDVDNDGQITFVGNTVDAIGLYYLGLSSMPQLVLDPWGGLFLVFTSVTETFDNGTQNYRHVWARYSPDGGTTWLDFVDLSSDLIHIFDECVYPSCASYTYEYLYLVYQTDGEPGLSLWGDLDPATENKATFMKVQRHEITDVKENTVFINDYDVYQNYPNPFSATTTIPVNLRKPGKLTLEVYDYTGKTLEIQSIATARPGLNKFTVSAESLPAGIYFYRITAGDNSVVKKMVVR